MSHYDHEQSKSIDAADYPFYALIMAAMRQADSRNRELLWQAFPDIWDEVQDPGAIRRSERGLARRRSRGMRRHT
jgi:hypothetical protein